jgi:hypothetical protein
MDLIRLLLQRNPDDRPGIVDLWNHRWVSAGGTLPPCPFSPSARPCPAWNNSGQVPVATTAAAAGLPVQMTACHVCKRSAGETDPAIHAEAVAATCAAHGLSAGSFEALLREDAICAATCTYHLVSLRLAHQRKEARMNDEIAAMAALAATSASVPFACSFACSLVS